MFIDVAFLSDTFLKLCAALPVTLGLFICSFLCGGVLAVGVLALRMSRWPLLSNVAKGYILVFRGSPLLIQLFLIYYGLGQFGVIRHSFLWPLLREPFICAVLALALCTAAYTAEILRGALLAVPSGQIEAGQACGMSRFLLLRRIIAPVMLRYALPAYSTEAIFAGEIHRAGQSGDGVGCDRRGAANYPENLPDDGGLSLRRGYIFAAQLYHRTALCAA